MEALKVLSDIFVVRSLYYYLLLTDDGSSLVVSVLVSEIILYVHCLFSSSKNCFISNTKWVLRRRYRADEVSQLANGCYPQFASTH